MHEVARNHFSARSATTTRTDGADNFIRYFHATDLAAVTASVLLKAVPKLDSQIWTPKMKRKASLSAADLKAASTAASASNAGSSGGGKGDTKKARKDEGGSGESEGSGEALNPSSADR